MGILQFNSEKVAPIASRFDNVQRTVFTDGVGKNITSAGNLAQALELSGLNYKVEKFPIQFTQPVVQMMGDKQIVVQTPYAIKDKVATVRTDTMQSLGIVSPNYEILNNEDAFDFLDSLVEEGAHFETAGSYGANGAKNIITMSTEGMNILGDDYKPYLLLQNSHDGSRAISISYVSIRIFCSNCLARARKGMVNEITIRHSSSMNHKLEAARLTLMGQRQYLEEFKKECEEYAKIDFSENQFFEMAKELFPVHTEDKDIIQIRNLCQIDYLMKCYKANDLDNFTNRGIRALQAVADFESHPVALRTAKTPMGFTAVINGMPLLNRVYDIVGEAA